LIYGWMSRNMPVILANAVTLVLASVILSFKIKHRNSDPGGS
jgi:uncharacterized protein with PQ loop repeat